MPNDHGSFRHESLRDTCNRKTFFAEILLPKMSEHFMNLWSFKFNGSSLAADINYAEMIFIIQTQFCESLLSVLESNNKPPVWRKTQDISFTSVRRFPATSYLLRKIDAQRFSDCSMELNAPRPAAMSPYFFPACHSVSQSFSAKSAVV